MSAADLPTGWVETRLGEYLYLKNGYAFKSTAYIEKNSESYPVIRISDISNNIASDKNAIHVVADIQAANFQIQKDDLLIAMSGATTGKVGIYTSEVVAYQNQRVGNLKLHVDRLGSKKFRNYLIKSISSEVLKIAYGGAQPNISGSAIEDMMVALPPLAEQQQIAAKLDELVAQVDSLKTRLDVIPKILKRFRQSVLAAAVSGKLTEDWRGNANYSSVDLALSKQKIEIDFAQDWQTIRLGKVTKIISGNAFKSTDFIKSGIPVIKISNVQYGEFEIKNQEYLPSEFLSKFENFTVYPADVLMALTRPITNDTLKICRYPLSAKNGLLNQRVCKFSFTNEKEKVFFELVFQSSYFKSQVEDNLSETLQPNLSPTDLKMFIVGVPNLDEQTEIVRRVEQLFAYADQIEQRVKDAQSRVNHLTQSVLAKAFRGELTAEWREQNLDLISGDNSAEGLLARIQAEREASGKVTKRSRKVV